MSRRITIGARAPRVCSDIRRSNSGTRNGEPGSTIFGLLSGLLVAGLGLLAQAPALTAQVRDAPPGFGEITYWTVGYSANAPSQLLGFGTALIPVRLGGWGVYADVKLTLDSPADDASFHPDLTARDVEAGIGDSPRRAESGWTTVNLAAVRPITPDFAVYAGAGYSSETAYRQYFDPDRERSPSGLYWVEDRDRSGTRVNLLGGALLRFGERLVFQLGGESAPTGFSAGAAVAFPGIGAPEVRR